MPIRGSDCEPITIKVNVENIGEVNGTYVVTLVDGKAEATKEVPSWEERLLP